MLQAQPIRPFGPYSHHPHQEVINVRIPATVTTTTTFPVEDNRRNFSPLSVFLKSFQPPESTSESRPSCTPGWAVLVLDQSLEEIQQNGVMEVAGTPSLS